MSEDTTIPDPGSRCYTALFVLLGRMLARLRQAMRKPGREIDYPVTRPGQDAVECYTLAVLVFVLVTGIFSVTLGECFGSHMWSYVLALPLGIMLTFAALHVLFFGLAFVYNRLLRLHFFSPDAPQLVPVRVYLLFFTALAVGIALTGHTVFIAVAAPWLFLTLLNLLAATLLFAADFISLLAGDTE